MSTRSSLSYSCRSPSVPPPLSSAQPRPRGPGPGADAPRRPRARPKRRSSTACSTSGCGRRRLRSSTSCRPSRPKGSRRPSRPTCGMLYDDKALYIGVICFDSEPSAPRHDRLAARLVAERPGLVSDHSRHLPRQAERVHLRDDARRPAVRRAGPQRRRDASAAARRPAVTRRQQHRRGRRREHQLGRLVGSEDPGHRHGMDRGVRDPAAHAALRPGAADLGRELRALHRTQARSRSTGRRSRASTR